MQEINLRHKRLVTRGAFVIIFIKLAKFVHISKIADCIDTFKHQNFITTIISLYLTKKKI